MTIKFIDIKRVSEDTGLSKPQIYKLIRLGRFPKQARLSPGKVMWDAREVEEWKEQLLAARAEPHPLSEKLRRSIEVRRARRAAHDERP